MATKLLAISGRATALACRQPRLAVGGSMLSFIILAELAAAMALHGGVS
jgi:hypothetical protein